MRLTNYLNEESDNNIIIRDIQIENYFISCSEMFDSESEVTIIKNDSDLFTSKFYINNIEFNFLAKIKENRANIIFFPIDNNDDIFDVRNDKKYAGSIFASVLQSTKIMLNKKTNINEIIFVAENKQLEKLYNKMNFIILKYFPKWQLADRTKNKGKTLYRYTRE